MIDKHTMTIGDVARVLGLGTDRVRQLDDVLKPTRLGTRHRRYDVALVERYAKQRADVTGTR